MTARRTREQEFVETFGEVGRALSTAMVAFHQAVADRLGLHMTDHKALGVLFQEGAMPAGRLAELTGLTTGAVTAMIDRLESAGYVRRDRDPDDRRKVIVAPLPDPAHRERLREHFSHMQHTFAEALPDYNAQEKALLLDFLRRSTEALWAATARVRNDP